MRLVIGCLSLALGCGFHPSVGPDAVTHDGPVDSPDSSTEVFSSCKALHDHDGTLPTGPYTIAPDGSTQISVGCDMTTNGGGWTIVFMAADPNISAPVTYIAGVDSLLTAATTALIAYRAGNFVAAPNNAMLDMPPDWRSDVPFNAPGNDTTVQVTINGGTAGPGTVRYGSQTFTTRCEDPWSNTGTWGRVCVVGTTAPFFNGFASAQSDKCSDSLSVYDATPCTSADRFSIAIR